MFSNLDSQQEAAAHTDSKKVLLIAGAGSGKTKTLIERMAYLLETQKVSPFELCSFSFTRKASNEIRERLEKRIGPKAHKCMLGTMHSIGLQMVRRFGELIGWKPNQITVYGEFETEFLLKETAKEIGFLKGQSGKKGSWGWKIPKREIDQMFREYYETGEPPKLDHPARTLFDAFTQRMRENNSLTYDALLLALELLIPYVAQYLHIKHILVDEVQDISACQWRIINAMCGAFDASLFAVGDYRQSIYSFRGADPGYLLRHQDDFTTHELQSNYRSVPPIVHAANRLMEHAKDFLGGGMWATRGNDDSSPEYYDNGVHIVKNSDSASISEKLSLEYDGQVLDETAVLARNHALLRKLSEELTIRQVPHTYIGRKSALTNSEEFRRFHAFLKLLCNEFDNFSFVLVRELLKITPSEYADIRVTAATYGESHFQAWIRHHAAENDPYAEFFHLVQHDCLAAATWSIKAIFNGAVPYSEPIEHYDIEETFHFVMTWAAENPNGSIKQYLDWLATFDLQDEIKSEPEGVTLLTIHGAKGLEFNTVIIAGCNEGILPSKQAIAADEIEEERRLFYTAMTRARDQLVLTIRPERKEIDGKVFENPVSRFVGESNA